MPGEIARSRSRTTVIIVRASRSVIAHVCVLWRQTLRSKGSSWFCGRRAGGSGRKQHGATQRGLVQSLPDANGKRPPEDEHDQDKTVHQVNLQRDQMLYGRKRWRRRLEVNQKNMFRAQGKVSKIGTYLASVQKMGTRANREVWNEIDVCDEEQQQARRTASDSG